MSREDIKVRGRSRGNSVTRPAVGPAPAVTMTGLMVVLSPSEMMMSCLSF